MEFFYTTLTLSVKEDHEDLHGDDLPVFSAIVAAEVHIAPAHLLP